MEHIALSGAPLGGLPITNTLLTSLLVVVVLVALSRLATRNMKLVPSGLQNAVEWLIETLYNLFGSLTDDDRKTRMFFGMVATFFLFIVASNYIGLLPGIGTIGFYHHGEFVPFFKSPASDLNMTLALGLFSVVGSHIIAFRQQGLAGYLGLWLNKNPFLLFSGVLEFFLEFAKIVSLSFRLFGNIFAGETVLDVVSTIASPFLAPLPFLGLEVIVGFVQALVFAMLTLASLVILTMDHSQGHGAEEGVH